MNLLVVQSPFLTMTSSGVFLLLVNRASHLKFSAENLWLPDLLCFFSFCISPCCAVKLYNSMFLIHISCLPRAQNRFLTGRRNSINTFRKVRKKWIEVCVWNHKYTVNTIFNIFIHFFMNSIRNNLNQRHIKVQSFNKY